jgi:YHS domain-containing protein
VRPGKVAYSSGWESRSGKAGQPPVLDETTCRRLAEQCLKADTVGDVRALLGRPPTQQIVTQPVGEDEAIDPVCGMVVHTADTPYVLRVGGVAHFFCSRSCLMHFVNHRETKEGNPMQMAGDARDTSGTVQGLRRV